MPEQSYRRNSLRYPGYDYSQPGAVFVTINTHERQHLFGHIADGCIRRFPAGESVHDIWSSLPNRFPDILLDEFVFMPDHLHGIIMTGTNPVLESQNNSVGYIINSFKNQVASAWRAGVQQAGWPRYEGKLWHRDYYERIIRNDVELEAIQEYILGNPARWEEKRGR
jgi:REP element-mobilizing transposase RayT